MIIRTGMSSGEGSEIVLDMERLHEIYILSAEKLEDICDDACSDISLWNKNAHVLIEPLRIETCTAASCLECSLVNIVIYVTVDVVFLRKLLDAKSGFHAADEFVILDIAHHFVLALKLVCIRLHLLIS